MEGREGGCALFLFICLWRHCGLLGSWALFFFLSLFEDLRVWTIWLKEGEGLVGWIGRLLWDGILSCDLLVFWFVFFVGFAFVFCLLFLS